MNACQTTQSQENTLPTYMNDTNTPLANIEKKAYTHSPTKSGSYALLMELKENREKKILKEEYAQIVFQQPNFKEDSLQAVYYFSFYPETDIFNIDTPLVLAEWSANKDTNIALITERGRTWLEVNLKDKTVFSEEVPPGLMNLKNWNSYILSVSYDTKKGYVILTSNRKTIINFSGITLVGKIDKPEIRYGIKRTQLHQWLGKIVPAQKIIYDDIHIGSHTNMSTDLVE